jgi:HD-GYP domain-containing protein (c-di-GMP phosphodiesterase class II)
MKDPVPFLTALGQALSTLSLYHEGHPSRERALKSGHAALEDLIGSDGSSIFSFLGSDVVCDRRVLREVKGWEWGRRLGAIGMERIEFRAPISTADFGRFVLLAYAQLRGDAESEPGDHIGAGIRWGRVSLAGEELEALAAELAMAPVEYSLREEVQGVEWLQREVSRTSTVPFVEAETIIRSLALAMRQEGQVVLPLLELQTLNQYAVTHACNVSVLAMGLAEYFGFGPREVRSVGVAALLHDVGELRLPSYLVAKTGPYTEEERLEMQEHTVEGAKLILMRHRALDLAAVVAYEHHLRPDGAGYPRLRFERTPHLVSRMIRVCEAYDAMSTARPYRPAVPADDVLGILQQESGTGYDPEVVAAFATMVGQTRTTRVSVADPVVQVDGIAGNVAPES